MNFRSFISLNLYNLSVISKKKTSLLRRSRIFRDYIRITFKDVFFNKLLQKKLTKEKINGMAAYFADYEIMRSLFEEIFLEEQYLFFSGNEIPLIIDCGANIGMAALYFKSVYPDSKIICFEPDPVAFGYLKKNVELNKLSGVELHQNAVAAVAGELDFYVENDHETSLSMSLFGEPLQKKNKNVKKIRIKSVLLSDFINEKIDLLKIDVEGAEYEVFDELNRKEKLKLIENIIVEGHVFNKAQQKKVGELLQILELNDFTYLITNPFGLSNIGNLDNWKFMLYAKR